MTIGAILGAIAALGTIVGGLVYMAKLGVWIFKKAPSERSNSIDEQIQKEKEEARKGGRPKWE